MAVYWQTFRINSDAGYTERYDNLVETVRKMASRWWVESTSFWYLSAPTTSMPWRAG